MTQGRCCCRDATDAMLRFLFRELFGIKLNLWIFQLIAHDGACDDHACEPGDVRSGARFELTTGRSELQETLCRLRGADAPQ